MSRILCKVGGGGGKAPKGDAIPANVLAGKTFSNKGNVGLVGSMINRGAVTATIGAGETYAIGDGYHNGNGIITAKSLASETPGTATAPDILTGKTAWVNGVKVTGSIISQAGGTYNPTTSVKTLVSGGRYVSSDVKVNAFALPPASALKKGYKYTLYGQSVTGTFEGYTTSPLYIVQNGTVKNLSTNNFDNTEYMNMDNRKPYIGSYLRSSYYNNSDSSYAWIRSNAVVNCVNYNYLKVDLAGQNYYTEDLYDMSYEIGIGKTTNNSSIVRYATGQTNRSLRTVICDISSYNDSYFIFVGFKNKPNATVGLYCLITNIYFTTT